MSQIEIRNVWKRYGDRVVLERLQAEVEAGEFVAIVGASGCGKTTFLKILLGTESFEQGHLLLDGVPLAQEPGPERGIVFQKYSVFPHLTALENIVLSREFEQSPLLGKLLGTARRRALAEARDMLAQVGLQEAADRYPHELSGGMQQRLALAQSLMKKPKILLLDEPFGALDPGIRTDMHQLVRQIWQNSGVTIFMITHDIKEGFSLGTRVWVFDKVRQDPHEPGAYGATITYDIPVSHGTREILP